MKWATGMKSSSETGISPAQASAPKSSARMESEEKLKQERASLLRVGDSFKKIIIVKDVVNVTRDEYGITTMSIYDFFLMETTNGDPTPEIWAKYDAIAAKKEPNTRKGMIERFAFYERAKKAYCIIQSGETAIYANIILKKGVVK